MYYLINLHSLTVEKVTRKSLVDRFPELEPHTDLYYLNYYMDESFLLADSERLKDVMVELYAFGVSRKDLRRFMWDNESYKLYDDVIIEGHTTHVTIMCKTSGMFNIIKVYRNGNNETRFHEIFLSAHEVDTIKQLTRRKEYDLAQ